MAIPQDRQSAKDLVETITEEHGYLSEEQLRDHMIGSSVITLSKNLYTSKARFVFELLQNADDNSYSKAREFGTEPFVSFRVYPDRIILECNEDGFNHDNLVAICSIGQSSKMGAQGYIGEKGIGFKSVFMAAWKVHIQSGAFSFSFTHKPGDSGMGMISPIWEDAGEELPESPVTRITLHLHEIGDEDMAKKTRQTIEAQFEELQETFLLFMKNLQKIDVAFYDKTDAKTSSAKYSIARPHPDFAILSRIKTDGQTEEKEVKRYHITRQEATELAKNENRNYTDMEESSRAYSKSQVILAFPLSETSAPVIQPQDLFVFLPVRSVGFSFLIQADFVTDASRQDIVKDSLRNMKLLDGVADAFVKAVLQFCQHDSLRYQWVRYLPNREANTWGALWLSLIDKIADRLSKTPVVLGRHKHHLRLVGEMFSLREEFLDEKGMALLEDMKTDQIISQHYKEKDTSLLVPYGLRRAYHEQFNHWLKADLEEGANSRMKARETSSAWHSRVANLLLHQLKRKRIARTAEIKGMDILPLQDGTWASASSGPVYFAYVDMLEIPPDIELRLICRTAEDPHRRALFHELGVKAASIDLVRENIFHMYPEEKTAVLLDTPLSKRHLKFLYLSHEKSADKGTKYKNLIIFDTRSILRRPSEDVMYIRNNHEWGVSQLLQKTIPGPNPGDGAPGYPAVFVNNDYFVDCPPTPDGQTMVWHEWFYRELKVQKIVDIGAHGLSEAGQYLQKYRPERFLGCVHRWILEKNKTSPDHLQYLRDVEVLCEENRQVLLKHAYFPTEELKKRVERYLGDNSFFPWLKVEIVATPETIPPEWIVTMKTLGVGSPASDLDLSLDMLYYSVKAIRETMNDTNKVKLFELYEHISAKQREADDQKEAKTRVQEFFNINKCIFVPFPGNTCAWASSHECVWKAPQALKSKHALEYIYGANKYAPDPAYLFTFFTDTLGVTDGSWDVYVNELRTLSESGCDDADSISGIYEAMDAIKSTIDPGQAEVSNVFEASSLIYAPSDSNVMWHKASECVWSTTATLKGKISISEKYQRFEELFVKYLGVKTVDLLMAVEELSCLGRKASVTQEEAKEAIWTVNALIPGSKQHPSKRCAVGRRIFPVRDPDGNVRLESKSAEFFVADRDDLKSMFKTKVSFIDFSQKDVVRLQPFLDWAGLQAKYLSASTREVTSCHTGPAQQSLNSERRIRNRAHALLRIASHFNSPRIPRKNDLHAFYHFLQKTKIFETNGISSNFILKGAEEYEAEGKTTSLHIDDSQECLKIFLPVDEDDQEYIFTKLLSQRLFEWLMRDPDVDKSGPVSKDGASATRDVMLAPIRKVHRALEENGISAIEIANTYGDNSQEVHHPMTAEANVEDQHESISTTSASNSSGLQKISSNSPLATPKLTVPTLTVVEDEGYVALLEKVIGAARQSDISESGASGMKSRKTTKSSTAGLSNWGLRVLTQTERDYKVGAAGELYVFELLSNLVRPGKLPGFCRDNWQSNIRHYVTAHPEYETMDAWLGAEVADLVYNDSKGAMTERLIARGYLEKSAWQNKRPQYLIEVKTTTSNCDTPFFVSKAQCEKIKENTESTETIYAIFRVFNLGRDDMDLRVYLDPEALRQQDDLKFTSESWSVVPTNA
ncbi:hypothetical protein PG987_013016 [Apiospora arundinis]